MAKITVRERTRCLKAQAQLSKSVSHIEALVASVVGDNWLDVVNRERSRDGRREYRTGAADERAALALFAHAPGVRDRWNAQARIASQLGGLLNAAHHNDSDRWTKGDADRAEQLTKELLAFLAEHPTGQLTATWTVEVDLGHLPPRKRKPVSDSRIVRKGQPGQPARDVIQAACDDQLAGCAHPGAGGLAALTISALAGHRGGHVRVDYRHDRPGKDPATVTVTAKRTKGAAKTPLVIAVNA